jgi:predicted ribosomally synthesized peptide with SipW-like signal peptide
MNKKILPRIILVVSVVLFAVYSTNAFFSDTETSTGNTFQAGAIDLKIDNESYYNGEISPNTTWDLDDLTGHLFFDFSDIKPGDWGEDTISLHVNTNDAWACMDLSLTKNDDNDCTEPELENDSECTPDNGNDFDGELGQNIKIIFWNDDGDNVLEDDEETSIFRDETVLDLFSSGMWALAQSQQQGRILLDSDLNEDGAMVGGKTYYIAKGWCFGNMSIDPVAQDGDSHTNSPTTNPGFSCDGSQLDNATQTDSIEGDFSFYAEQARHNPDFVCEECFETVYVQEVVENNQGTKKDGSAITGTRADPDNALGAPDWASGTGTNFFSLGKGGSIVLAFSSPVQDKDGDDLSFHEATNGRPSYPLESAEVFVSADNSTYYSLGNVTSEPGGDGVFYLDISSNVSAPSSIKYIKLVDNTDYSLHGDEADGYDLDAVDAVYGQCEVD